MPHNHQHTINESISVSGIGLHTGKPVTLTLHPADIDTGYRFKRSDISTSNSFACDVFDVTATERGTTLTHDGIVVNTIEHVLSALVGSQVHNCLIEVDNQEIPILDGSALPFVEMIKKVGRQKQKALIEFYAVNKPISYQDDEKNVEMIALPYDGFKVTSMIDFDSEILGQQHASLEDMSEYENQIAPARTFCLFRELKYLAQNNLIKGGDLDNAVVVVDQPVSEEELDELSTLLGKPKMKVEKVGVLNNSPMRFSNEPARHKLLDIIGDLALIGKPIKAHIIAKRPGHKTNVEFAKIIKRKMI